MTSNPRQTRTGGNNEATNAQPTDARRAKTFLDKWIEPPLRPPAPSFMDNPNQDIIRHGVLSTMAPLGTLPSSKVKKLAKSDGPRRLTFVKKGEQPVSAASTPREAVTPEPPANSSGRRSESHKMEDTEWNPTTPIAQSGSLKDTTPGRLSSPHASPYSVPSSPRREAMEYELAGKAVKWAVKEAVAADRLLTAYALLVLFHQQDCNPGIVKLFIRIGRREANEKEHADFRGWMRFKKEEGRKDIRAAEQQLIDGGYIHSHSARLSAAKSDSYRRNGVPEATTEFTRSPHKESEGPLHKKHKINRLDDKSHQHNHVEVNGHENLTNDTPLQSRGNSLSPSSDSELSEIDESRLTEDPRESSANSAASPKEATGKRRGTTTVKASISTTTADSDVMGRRSNRPEPMAQQRTLGPKLEAWNSNANSGAPSTSSSTRSSASLLLNHQNLQAQNIPTGFSDALDITLSDPLATQSSSEPLQHAGIRFFRRGGDAATQESDDTERKIRLKRKAKDITDNSAQVHESYDRHRVVTRAPGSQAHGGNSLPASGKNIRPGQILRFRSSQAGRKVNDDYDELSSQNLPPFASEGVLGSSANSRAGTPGVLSRPGRKPKGGLRMKTSPMKKKAGPSAGIPRASGERNSPVGNGTLPYNQDDNDDYCSSCGGNGDLVCCDGCTRSFHFRCVDPPLSESQLPDNWFCNHCNASRNPRANDDFSTFGQLLSILDKKNPSAFHLHKEIREYFEGVRTGGEGEYEEAVHQKPKRNAGYEEPPDYLKLKDGKGSYVLCHECNKGAGDGSPIIACSFCSLQWHLDCLDPPLANPPPLGKPWRCPCHVDDLLAKVPGALGPAHRFRKIKGASVTRPAFARGFKNDGHVEIELTPTDDEEDGFFERKEYGKIYKLPEEGIKLDFLARARSLRATSLVSASPVVAEMPRERKFTSADRRSIQEQQAALNVAQLAVQEDNTHGAQTLIDALLSQASPAVVALIAQGDASNIANRVLSQGDKQSLLAMKAVIDEALQQTDRETNSSTAESKTGKDVVLAKDELDMLI